MQIFTITCYFVRDMNKLFILYWNFTIGYRRFLVLPKISTNLFSTLSVPGFLFGFARKYSLPTSLPFHYLSVGGDLEYSRGGYKPLSQEYSCKCFLILVADLHLSKNEGSGG